MERIAAGGEGFAADLVLRAAFRTVPLVDLNLTLAAPLVLVAALVFLAAGVAGMGGVRTWTRPDARGALALIAVPALFLVAETGGTNGAQVALAAGLGLGPEPPRATQLGTVLLGLGLAAGSLALSRRYPRGVAAAIACAAGAVLLWYVHAPVVSLVGGLVLAAGLFIAAATIPGAIQGDCSVDVTQAIQSWIDSVPDNSVLSFGSGDCYRIDDTLELTGRNGLTFEGNGATFDATTAGGTWSRARRSRRRTAIACPTARSPSCAWGRPWTLRSPTPCSAHFADRSRMIRHISGR